MTLDQLAEQAAQRIDGEAFQNIAWETEFLPKVAETIIREALEAATKAADLAIVTLNRARNAADDKAVLLEQQLEAQRGQLKQTQKDVAAAKHLSDLACRARDAYSDERDRAYRECAGWRDLAADYKQQLAQIAKQWEAEKARADMLRGEMCRLLSATGARGMQVVVEIAKAAIESDSETLDVMASTGATK